MIKQLEQIKQIAIELGGIFEDYAYLCQCIIKLPSAYYATGYFGEDPSTVYIFRYNEKQIVECLCYNKLIFDFEDDKKLIWVGRENYDNVTSFDDKTVKETLTRCLKELKEKEEEIKIKNLGADFE